MNTRPTKHANTPGREGPYGVLVPAGLGLYLALFYAARMPTIEQITGHAFRRVDYWQFLLLPEMLLGVWFGEPPAFSLLDRLLVLLLAALIVAYSATVGWVLLAAVGADRALTRLEAFAFSTAVGLATVSTYTLAAGLLGAVRNPMTFALPAVLSMAVFSKLWLRRATESARQTDQAPLRKTAAENREPTDWLDARWLWLAAPFVLVVLLGGVLPPVDFDVMEYHLQAPKEFYTQGRIGFLPHNVYANMPLGASMFALAAMGITGDWWLGALVGKTVIALTAPLTALAVLAAGRRLHSNTAGTLGAVLYLATPWVVHVSTAGLVESPLAMYSFLAIYAGVLLPTARAEVHASSCRPSQISPNPDVPASHGRVSPWTFLHPYANFLLAGYLAGAAAACKYPGVLFVLVPLLAWTAWRGFRREVTVHGAARGVFSAAFEGDGAVFAAETVDDWTRTPSGPRKLGPSPRERLRSEKDGATDAGTERLRPWFSRLRAAWKPIAVLLCAAALGGGLWYAKNWAFTGNPTYPLLFEVFGDRTGTWDAARNAQWNRVHLPDGFSPVALGRDLATVFLGSEWLGPLLFPLALLALALRRPRREDLLLAGYFAWFLAAWWLLTHRIDRFWIPSLAVVAVLAGAGATWTDRAWWRRALLGLLLLTSLASLLVAVSPAPGNYKRFFLPLERARTDPLRVNPWHLHFNGQRPEGKLLLVGDAAVFDLAVPILYGTCFDETPLRRLAGEGPAEEIRRRLAEAGVSHVLVHWGEIARYRATYGFDPWVQPERFEKLVEQGVLAPLPPIDDHPARAYRVVR